MGHLWDPFGAPWDASGASSGFDAISGVTFRANVAQVPRLRTKLASRNSLADSTDSADPHKVSLGVLLPTPLHLRRGPVIKTNSLKLIHMNS